MLALLLAVLSIAPTPANENTCLETAVTEIRYSISRFARLGDVSKRIAKAITKSAIENQLTPEFLLAVAIWESDLNPKATAEHPQPDGTVAIDVGLMGIRCIVPDLQAGRRCLNAPVRGLELRRLQEVETNIRVGAQMLAGLRNGPVRIWTRGRAKNCSHDGHAFYAHYNWGHQIIAGSQYDKSVATITRGLTQLTGCAEATELVSLPEPRPRPDARARALVKILSSIKLEDETNLPLADRVCSRVSR